MKIEVDHAKAMATVDLLLERRLRELDRDAADRKTALLEHAAEAEQARWYERPPVVATIAVALSFAAVWAAGQLSR